MSDAGLPRHTFEHEAMHTTFALTLVHADARLARQAAQAAFAELDLVEGRLSRFMDGTDVSRINSLRDGGRVVVHPDTMECLKIAEELRKATWGAFNVGYRTPAVELVLDETAMTIGPRGGAIAVDTGGIGKGYGLDAMARLLADWDLGVGRLCASASTVLALDAAPGEAGWTVEFGPAADRRSRALARQGFSGSGTAVQGAHIFDPRTGRPVTRRARAWSLAPDATRADALSTAFLILSAAEIRTFCRAHPGCFGAWLDREDGPLETT